MLFFTNRFAFFFRAKLNEIKAGADGFLVFDPDLVKPLIQVNNHDYFTFVLKPKYVLYSYCMVIIQPFIVVSFVLIASDETRIWPAKKDAINLH